MREVFLGEGFLKLRLQPRRQKIYIGRLHFGFLLGRWSWGWDKS